MDPDTTVDLAGNRPLRQAIRTLRTYEADNGRLVVAVPFRQPGRYRHHRHSGESAVSRKPAPGGTQPRCSTWSSKYVADTVDPLRQWCGTDRGQTRFAASTLWRDDWTHGSGYCGSFPTQSELKQPIGTPMRRPTLLVSALPSRCSGDISGPGAVPTPTANTPSPALGRASG